MRPILLPAILAFASVIFGADAELEAALAKVSRYNYDQGRQPLLDLENHLRRLPAGDVEKRLIEFLRSDASIAGKDFICRQLSLIGGAASVPVLAAMLSSPMTVEMGRYALERIPAREAATALRAALESAPPRARPGIANTLGIKRDGEAMPALARLATSPDPLLADAAANALGRIATPAAMTSLAALRKKNVGLEASLIGADLRAKAGDRSGALAVYRELSSASTPTMIRIGALEGLASTLGNEAVPQLAAVMEDSDGRVQAAAIRLLSAFPGAEVTRTLQAMLPKIGPPSRARIVTALAERGDRAAVPAIVSAVRDSDEGVRIAAVAAVALIGDPASVPMLAETAASETSTEAERVAARSALDQMRGDAVDKAIVAALKSGKAQVKLELIRSVGERGITAAVGELLEAGRSEDTAVRRAAMRALRDTAGPEQVSDLVRLLVDAAGEADRREAERALAAALRRSPPSKSSEVVDAYRSATRLEVKSSLLQVMGQAGTAGVLPPLRECLGGCEPDLVRAAVLALAEWPTDEPLTDLFAFSSRTQNAAHQVLSQRAILRLLDLPTKRPAGESIKILGTLMAQARQAEEKRSILALVVRFPSKEALVVAEAAANDPSVAVEAKAAAQRLRRSLGLAP